MDYEQGPNERPKLDINNNKDIFHLIDKIDRYILQSAQFPDDVTQLSHISIKNKAIDLYKIIHGIESVPRTDMKYQKYIINVFRLFSDDPLKNANVQCAVKSCTNNLTDSEPYVKLDKREMEKCQHTFNDDQEIKQRYLLQYWFLNFCKYLCIMLLNSKFQQQVSDTLYYEDNKDLVD